MKLIIAGSRNFDHKVVDDDLIENLLRGFKIQSQISEVVSGNCQGIDSAGELWAANWQDIPIKDFPADWDKHGKSAGPKRNKQMAEYGDALLLIWDGRSKGSFNMKSEMMKLGKPVYEVILRKV